MSDGKEGAPASKDETTNSDKKQETKETPKPADKVPEGYVSRAELEHALKDVQKFKARTNELEEKTKKEEEQRLRETENWKQLAELKGKEADEAKERLEKVNANIVENTKYSAVKEAALKAGIRAEALNDLGLIGLQDVVVETTSTGRVNVLGADRFIDNLKTIRPHWFGKANLNVNGNLPGSKTGAVANESELIKLSLEAQKTGDYTTYAAKLKQFQQTKGV